MIHPDFIAWMISFPISLEIAEWIRSKHSGPRKEYSESVRGFAAMIVVALWLGIGAALW